MKHKFWYMLLCLALAFTLALPSAADAPECLASDEMLRAQLRLRDLGYYYGSIDGTNHAEALSALHAFCTENGLARSDVPPPVLFTPEARPAPYPPRRASLPGDPIVTGRPLPWREALPQMKVGEAYAVTACYSGMSCEMRFLGGDGHAHMTPLHDGDADTLLQIFDSLRDYGKQPVVIRLGGELAAASLQAYLHRDDAGDADTTYSLYFTGSVSDVGGIPDADHADTVRIAANAPGR